MAVGIILAGGSGVRFGNTKPKQFTALAGRPIMDYAIETFSLHPQIERLYVTFPAGFRDDVEAIVAPYRRHKPVDLVEGGSSRAASTRAALAAIGASEPTKLLFHDAVRPFLASEVITRTIAALDDADGADVVIQTADTIVQLAGWTDMLAEIPPRARLRRGQTPQGFWSHHLVAAYDALADDELGRFSDDCGVLLAWKPDAKIAAVEGSETNIKVTHPIDLFLAEQLLYRGDTRGLPVAEHKLDDPVAVIIGDTSGLGLVAREWLESAGWRVHGASRRSGVDVRDRASVERRLDEIAAETGKIDVVANFAGVLHAGSLVDSGDREIDDTVSTNFLGSIHVARAAHRHLSASRGQLVLCSSSSYFRGRKLTAAYSASKAAVVNLTQALAEEWSDDGIVVSCIVPRRADTPMRRKAFPNEDPALAMRPEEVAKALRELLQRRQSGVIKHVY